MRNKDSFTNWINDSGYRRYIPSWIWHQIKLTKPNFLGWETDEDGNPWFVMIEHLHKSDEDEIESKELRIKYDRFSSGLFYQRDWSSSGLPFIHENDLYWSGWWFQFKNDAERFYKFCKEKRYKESTSSWEEDYKEKEAEMRKRNSEQK